MNLIDIASYQSGISLPLIFQQNPIDGVIVKVTEGTGYVNPPAKDWLEWLIANDHLCGVYHYLNLAGAEAEARHFVNTAKPYVGKAVFVVDYEAEALTKGTGYLKACLDEVYRLTGVKPLVYCSQSVTQTQDFSAIAADGYKLWVAQYADMNTVYGFLDNPWQRGSVTPFDGFVMQQYTSCGRLTGWNGNLDFDKFFGTAEEWAKLANGKQPEPTPAPVPKPVDPEVISDVLDGKYGNGLERIGKLRNAGYDADSVQRKINELYGIAQSCKRYVGNNTDYINQIARIIGLM